VARAGRPGEQVAGFQSIFDRLHAAAGLEVIPDVAFNHTAEGNHLGPTCATGDWTMPPITGLDASDRGALGHHRRG
jgi:pullulanase/glycogen debranching enzyme